MIDALLYLQFQSLKNRLAVRLRRLRRPKYLFGALFGAAYLGLAVMRPLLMAKRDFGATGALPAEYAGLWEFAAAALLLLGMLLAWLLPRDRAGLVFTEAEIAFLFPAPVRRSALVHFKLLKAQLGILFTVAIFTLLAPRSRGFIGAGERAIGWWLIFSIINLHLLGSSFARTLLLGRGVSTWARRVAVAAIFAVAIGGTFAWVRQTIPAPKAFDVRNGANWLRYCHAAAASPPAVVLLAPFRAVVGPFFASDGRAFLRSLGPALALLALHYWWAIRSDVAFEEGSLEVSRQHATRVAAARGNRWAPRHPRRKARPPFPLAATGSPAVAMLWKNLLSAGQLFSLRIWAPVMVWGLCMGFVFSGNSTDSPWPQIVGTAAVVLAGFSVLIGPQIVRQDFRQDLAAVDLLKTYPMSSRQLALGQVLTPLVVLTAFQWLLLGVGALLLEGLHFTRAAQFGVAGCLALLAPPLNLITLLIPNAAALLYPGWFLGPQSASRGIETMGQRLMFLIALLAILALTIAPALATFGFVYLVGPWVIPDGAVLPAASVATALVLAMEGAAGVAGLGYLFERFDPSAETPHAS